MLFRSYRRFIFRAALRKGLSQEDAEEVLQDTVLSVAKGLHNFTYTAAGSSFKGWLMTITSRKVVDKLRKQGRQVPTTDLDGAMVEKITDDGFGPAWELEWEDNLIQAATDQLRLAVAPRSFQIFDWTVRMGRSTRETAKAFGISVVLVRVTKFRVIHRFKKILHRLEKRPWPEGCKP